MCCSQEVGQALLAGDSSDEKHVWPLWIDAVIEEDVFIDLIVVCSGVDAVVDDVDPGRVDLRVGLKDVSAHAGTDGDDRSCGAICGCLNPG